MSSPLNDHVSPWGSHLLHYKEERDNPVGCLASTNDRTIREEAQYWASHSQLLCDLDLVWSSMVKQISLWHCWGFGKPASCKKWRRHWNRFKNVERCSKRKVDMVESPKSSGTSRNPFISAGGHVRRLASRQMAIDGRHQRETFEALSTCIAFSNRRNKDLNDFYGFLMRRALKCSKEWQCSFSRFESSSVW